MLPKPEMQEGNPIRLYTLEEVRGILAGRGLTVFDSYADFGGTPSSENHIQLMVCSRKQ